MQKKKIFSTKDVARMLGISVQTLRKRFERKIIGGTRIGKGKTSRIYFTRDDIKKILRAEIGDMGVNILLEK